MIRYVKNMLHCRRRFAAMRAQREQDLYDEIRFSMFLFRVSFIPMKEN